MKIIQVDLGLDYSDVIREAINILNYGGTVVYPTDTLYGLGANALNEIAVRKVYKIKERSFSKPLPIIIRNMMWAKELAHISPRQEEILNKVWPGKVTAVLRQKDIIPNQVTADSGTIGMRVTDFNFLDKLLGKYGYPLVSTSANMSGDEGTGDINKIIATFEKSVNKPDLIIDVGVLPKSDPSVVIDLTSGKPKILRVGPSTPQQLLKLLEL